MLWYEISILCFAMVYIVKDMLDLTVAKLQHIPPGCKLTYTVCGRNKAEYI